jgi:hypothetical protein
LVAQGKRARHRRPGSRPPRYCAQRSGSGEGRPPPT